eukprot:CAMPEP_0119339634 /NCGR_PEP_ID=MMETSP1333-20130426/98673_1 /TAXON_ID=418940 /ORGANISM="Scyphosphaera apsteinii, Strain RCC1455" /LENGTH=313 /DNA_ID=CAMNT_0007351193 /DNA_START=297 /DNA_END=1239 /DNA_ORIENTATION=+
MESSLPPLFNGQPLRAIDLPEIPMDPATELSYVALEDKSIYIGGLPRHLTTELLTELLIQMGPVIQVRMLKDATGASKGAAFCDFADPRSAQYAIAALDTLPLVGRKLRVNRAGDSGRTHVPFMVVLQELACREPTTRLDRYDPRGAGRDSRREEVCREREDELNGNSRWSHIDDSLAASGLGMTTKGPTRAGSMDASGTARGVVSEALIGVVSRAMNGVASDVASGVASGVASDVASEAASEAVSEAVSRAASRAAVERCVRDLSGETSLPTDGVNPTKEIGLSVKLGSRLDLTRSRLDELPRRIFPQHAGK